MNASTCAGRERIEAGVRVAEDERRHPVRVAQTEIARDAAAERQPDEMRPRGAEVVDDAQHVGGEIAEGERALVVVGVAVPASIRRDCRELRRERRELVVPVRAVAADAVQEHGERTGAGDAEREPRRRADEDGHSARAPESFTACPRASRSRTRYAANASGVLATRS